MRLFIAAELPQEMLEALAETSAALRDNVRGRYVASDSFHVTLAFLGSVPTMRVDDTARALERGCAGHEAVSAKLGELGSFGKRSAATLWQGFDDAGEKALAAVAEDVRDELEAAGFEFDRKPFRGHVTLMRKANLSGGLLLPPATLAEGTIDTITLFSSDLSGCRPRYEGLQRVHLKS